MNIPTCTHVNRPVIVTNQPGDYDASRPHASARTCVREKCVRSAVAYVVEFTGEKPWRREDSGDWKAVSDDA